MISEKDKSVIDSYARCGMSLETLYISFPKFDKEDVKAVYDAYKSEKAADDDGYKGGISINCS